MPLPAQITTNLFPDFKNSFIGPFAKIEQLTQTSGSAGIFFGNASNLKVAQSFIPTVAGDLVSVDLDIVKNGSPTDSVIVKLCSDSSANPDAVLATSTAILGSTLLITHGTFRRFVFFLPYSVQTSTTYWIQVERTGSQDASNYYGLGSASSSVYANGTRKRLFGSWLDDSVDAKFKINIRANARYVPCVDKTNNKVRMFKSTDGGNTWSEQDSADAPAISTTANTKSISAFQVDTFIHVARVTDANGFAVFRFDTTTDQWETSSVTSSSSMPVNNSVSGCVPMLVNYKPLVTNWDYAAVCNGQTETVMGNARRRIKFKRRGSTGVWPTLPGYDLVGSPNTPDLTTLPGTAVDYDIRAALIDGDGVWHGFWTQSDDSNLRHRQFNENLTFSTTNLIGSTPATTSNAAAYSVGLPTNYYKSGEWYIAIPYVDSGVLKVARCLASGAATAANWTITSIVTATIETTNSNPCALVADNEQGGKLILIFTKSDGKLYYTHDQGSDSWVPEQELHPGTKTVGAISGGVMVDSIGIVYLDTSPTPDDLKFDSL